MNKITRKESARRAVIFANAPLPPELLIKEHLSEDDLIICADGGANRIVDFGIRPQVIIGDLDSVTETTLQMFRDAEIIRIPSQENSDLDKALQYCKKRSIRDVIIFGATGARSDHFLGNIFILKQYTDKLDITLIDEWCTVKPVIGTLTIRGRPGQTVSLLPVEERASGIRTTGLKYQLNNGSLFQDTRGISNQLTGSSATITVDKGLLIAIIHHANNIQKY